MPKVVFLDTNIFLHYRFFDQIDWLGIVNSETVTIIIPPVTIRELNKHKVSHPRPRVQKRAGEILKKLSTLFSSDSKAYLQDSVDLLLEDRDPLIDFAAYQLDPQIQDDQLIASIVMCRNETPSVETVLVTSDTGLALQAKARRLQITVIKLLDNLKVPDEPDPSQKRIRELEQKLRQLELRIPELSLAFEDGNQHIEFVLPLPIELTPERLEQELVKIRQTSSKMERKPKPGFRTLTTA